MQLRENWFRGFAVPCMCSSWLDISSYRPMRYENCWPYRQTTTFIGVRTRRPTRHITEVWFVPPTCRTFPFPFHFPFSFPHSSRNHLPQLLYPLAPHKVASTFPAFQHNYDGFLFPQGQRLQEQRRDRHCQSPYGRGSSSCTPVASLPKMLLFAEHSALHNPNRS